MSLTGASPAPRPTQLNAGTPRAERVGSASSENSAKGSGKRKREMLPVDELLEPSIIIKSLRASAPAKPYALLPIMLLPRESIPLADLDLTCPLGDLSSSPYFEARIKVLDLEDRLSSTPRVLLCEHQPTRAFYAVERLEAGKCIICKLVSSVDLKRLSSTAIALVKTRLAAATAAPRMATSTERPLATPQQHLQVKRRRLAIETLQAIVRKPQATQFDSQTQSFDLGSSGQSQSQEPAGEAETESQAIQVAIKDEGSTPTQHGASAPVPPAKMPAQDPVAPNSPPSGGDVLENLRSQYLDALYRSMGPLSYFAKGPLSRARATFQLDTDSSLDPGDLISFLKSLVMNTIIIDKKYRESIPAIISHEIRMAGASEDDQLATSKRSTKPKKVKIGKNGLYQTEGAMVKEWWRVLRLQNSDGDHETLEDVARHHTQYLKTRETKLQMIILLEILALERQIEATPLESQLPGTCENQDSALPESQQPPKKRNRHNFPVLLDVHVDRLCIWQSTVSEESKALAEAHGIMQEKHSSQTGKVLQDPLREFCVDVIVPFFSARVPDVCDSLSRKLGGPRIIPKSKPGAPVQAPEKKPKPKPATASRRKSEPGASTRSLQRVLSSDKIANDRLRRSVSRGPSGAIALLRSATTTALPGLKKEPSDSILLGRMASKNSSSAGDKSARERVSERTIGRNSVDRKTLVAAELQDAISALRKPNRGLAARELADEAARRGLQRNHISKKSKSAPRATGVIMATPANARFKDVFATGPGQRAGSESNGWLEPPEAPSSISIVPSSGYQPRNDTILMTSPRVQATPQPKPSLARLQQADGIVQATPLGRPSKGASGILAPLCPATHNIVASPARSSNRTLFQTPLKIRKASVGDSLARAKDEGPVAEPPPKKAESIFQRLGWDDFDDL